MRTIPLAVLGAPFAALALYGCLSILGVAGPMAVALAALWSVLWLVVAHLGPASKLFRRRRSARHGSSGGRGVWSAAVLCSFFLPIPVYATSMVAEWLRAGSAPLALPLVAILALPLPAALWWMLLWPSSTDREGEIIHPLGWRRFTPHAPSGVIPPRKDFTD
jgi:hypothetical protein